MTALSMAAIPEEEPRPRRLPWRRMGWVTWRQHRTALGGVVVFLGALAVCLWLAGLKLPSGWSAAGQPERERRR
jgi:sterol desaturase/sphingolipid hydroxylase (fatty acid hydroxylase superfamily)